MLKYDDKALIDIIQSLSQDIIIKSTEEENLEN